MREIYLDNSATTKPYKEVVKTVNEAMETMYYNPSSIYSKGVEVSKKIEIICSVKGSLINFPLKSYLD